MHINYHIDRIPPTDQIIEVYNSSGINRPTQDQNRIAKMYTHSNLIVSAWDGDRLVGVSRALTDFCYCCYLSDLAVRKDYQKKGIGNQLIQLTRDKIGEQVTLILLAAPQAMNYYPKVGFEKIENGFIINRTQ